MTGHLGVTPPVSLASGNAQDERNSETLRRFADRVAPQALSSDKQLREQLVQELEQLVIDWVREVAELQEVAVENSVNGKLAVLVPFGSYRLGLVESGSDLDAVVVTPAFVSKEDFFGTLVYKIADLGADVVTDLSVVREASTPVIKFVMRGVDVDLLFCSIHSHGTLLAADTLDKILNEDSLLAGLTDASARALNGPRVANDILRLIPQSSESSRENFLLVLRTVKFWAKSRAIYSNAMGYFGGVTWAILVARVCQLFPNMTASQLLVRFFKVFALWDWTHPVQLNVASRKFEAPHLRVWTANAVKPDLMPIITPSFPAMNSGYNVSLTTKAVLVEELKRAHAICTGKAIVDEEWLQSLVQPIRSDEFPCVLQIQATADRSAVLQKLCGFVESRMRGLLHNAERLDTVMKLRPLQAFSPDATQSPPSSSLYLGVSLGCDEETKKKLKPQELDMRPAVVGWMERLLEWSDARKIKDFYDVRISVVGKSGTKRRKLADNN